MNQSFDPLSFLQGVDKAHHVMVGQYFEDDYCPALLQIESMYKMTDLSSIEVPLSVKEMFEASK